MKNRLLNLIILLASMWVTRAEDIPQVQEQESQIEEGFVTFATASYFPILRVLLDSIKAFSTRPLVAFGINASIPFSKKDYPFLIKKRIDGKFKGRGRIFILKPKIILDCNIKYGIYVEADDIVTHKVDELFEIAREVKNYPLCPIHSFNVGNQRNIMDLLDVKKKTMHYVHGHVVFADSCKPFIQKWYNNCFKHIQRAINYDETILNVLLWKHNATEHLDLYDPYAKYIDAYLNGTLDEVYMNKYNKRILGPYMFHGYKNPHASQSILKKLKKFTKRSRFSKRSKLRL